ncbi:MAG: glucose-1-phosphate cytidylyltransferase [Gammaproteobacteria bacterium]|nr:glucose-1-phosphate cytidylyltransferase [Gammaproteobacteria bacterium]
MQVVILAGGLGTRISEESHLRPKPMIEIGGHPILWHIMKIFSHHGLNEFVICCGYKGYVIKEYFANYVLHSSDITLDATTGEMIYHQSVAEPWKVTLIDTGRDTMTGGRLKRVAPYLKEQFCMTYGDGVADVDISALIRFHESHGCEATVTSVMPPGRYGTLEVRPDNHVERFVEKPSGNLGLINGGFFVLNRSVIDRIEGDGTSWEAGPLTSLAADGQLMSWRHHGFWQAMDTLRDRNHLEEVWAGGNAPWKVWS